mgnify:CR=1 FL=1
MNKQEQFTPDDYIGLFNLKAMEKVYIRTALNRTHFNVKKASKLLGKTEQTVAKLIIKHNI